MLRDVVRTPAGEFLSQVVLKFAQDGITPPEAPDGEDQAICNDPNREYSYLYEIPPQPHNVYVFDTYSGTVPSVKAKESGVIRIQVTVRHKSAREAQQRIYRIFDYVCSLAKPEEDYISQLPNGNYAIFDPQSIPTRQNPDSHGWHRWTLSFPVKTLLRKER